MIGPPARTALPPEQSLIAATVATRRARLGAVPAAVYRHLAQLDRGPGCRFSERRMAATLCMSRATLRRALERIAAAGIASVHQTHGSQTVVDCHAVKMKDGPSGSGAIPPSGGDGPSGSGAIPPSGGDGPSGSGAIPPTISFSYQSINRLPTFNFAFKHHTAAENAILTVELIHYAAYRVTQGAAFRTERALANYAAVWYAPPDISTRCRCAPGRPVPPIILRLREEATRSVRQRTVRADESRHPAVVAELERQRAERLPTAEQLAADRHAATAWEEIAAQLRRELDDHDYDQWVRPVQAGAAGDRLVLFCPNRYVVDYLDRRLGTRIRELVPPHTSDVDIRVGGPMAA